MLRLLPAALACAALIFPSDARAQTDGQIAAYAAIHGTPPGGVAPVAPNVGRQAVGFRVQYGRQEMFGGNVNTIAGGFDFPIAIRHSAGFTVGYQDPGVDDADSGFMVGAQITGNLTGLHARPGEGFSIAPTYELQVGYARPGDTDVLSATAGLPFAFPYRGRTVSFIPFITPGFGWGRLSFDDENFSGTRFLLSGGAGLEFANGFGLHVGARRVFMEDAEMLWGAGLTLRPR
jgi:hypothetical protein